MSGGKGKGRLVTATDDWSMCVSTACARFGGVGAFLSCKDGACVLACLCLTRLSRPLGPGPVKSNLI